MSPEILLAKAQNSRFYLWVLNLSLSRIIPFNKPHGIVVDEVGNDFIKTKLPYRRRNLNHIKGLHACGMATLAEFTTGLSLLRKLDTKKYRLIMKTIEVSYHYQGKTHASARFDASDEWVENNIYSKLQSEIQTDVPVVVDVIDIDNNLLATATITWQIKDWEKVKTKV